MLFYIIRYSNRKLYCQTASKYITLKHVAQIIKTGNSIVVQDNRTKKDITKETLVKVLADQINQSPFTIPALMNMINEVPNNRRTDAA